MKKFLSALMIGVMFVSSVPVEALASRAERIGENVLSNVISVIIIDAIRNSSKSSRSRNHVPEDDYDDVDIEDSEVKTKTRTRTKTKTKAEPVIDLSEAQFQSFSEICLAGSLSEFQKKFENENISPDAVYIEENEYNTVITTLLQLAKKSPNPDIAKFLRDRGARE